MTLPTIHTSRGALRPAILGAALVATLASAAMAKPDLRDSDEVFSRIMTTAIANEIRDKCETIKARKIAATFYVLGVVKYAKDLGFTSEEIDDYRFDPIQQERLRVAVHAFLDENGVDREDPASYCPLGKREINAKSQIGKLLKSK